ncbi:hypothetical protein CW696_00340 [ANME-2 cluster archaeon]|nr:MAG: hypothetical protein CW696_00340 [ANME-2 cluster archaeon]
MSIRRYFDELKLYLVTHPIVESFEMICEKIGEKEGYLRVTIGLPDNSVMYCFEYVLSDGSIEISKYSFHWQDMAGNLICRWDNAPHHPELDNFPHHIHTKGKVGASSETNLRKVLSEAKAVLKQQTRRVE